VTNFTERITILSANEVEDIYGLPKLFTEERELYFAMNADELKIADSHRTLVTKLIFMLQLGYFKVKKMFFSFTYDEIRDDIEFIRTRYALPEPDPKHFEINKVTRWNQQQRILALFHYHDCDASWRVKLQEKACRCVRISSKPICIFKDLLTYLEKERVMLPAYSTLQKIISKALLEESNRLAVLAERHVTDNVANMLQELLIREDRPYMLTLLKKEPKNFQYKQTAQEIEKQKLLKPLYDFAKEFLPRLDISNDNIRYYASIVDYYTAFRIRQIHGSVSNVYLLCFIFHRYQRINDNLANTFIYHVRKSEAAAKLTAKSSIYELKLEGNEHMKDIGKVLNLFMDEEIADKTPFGEVKNRAFDILEKDKFPLMAQYISGTGFDQTELEWKALEKMAPTFKKNLRPIFLSLDFTSTSQNDAFMDAVNFLKTIIAEKKSLGAMKPDVLPQGFIRRKLKRYILEKQMDRTHAHLSKTLAIRSDRYEFLVYLLLRQNLESGDICIRDSTKFRSFEDDLIDNEHWKNKEQLFKELNLPILSRPIEETLAELKKELETLLMDVNKRIQEGKNQDIKITGSGENISWSLPYKKSEDTTNNLLFERLPQIEIRDLMSFVIKGYCLFL